MRIAQLKICDPVGLHARPAALVVQTAGHFNSEILVRNLTTGSDWVNAKSILDVLTLGVEQYHEIEISIDGDDEEHAVRALTDRIMSDSHENDQN